MSDETKNTESQEQKKDLPIEDYMLEEAESLFRMFKNDKATLEKAIEQREKDINKLNSEQEVDRTTLNKLMGGLAVLQSLVTKYRGKHHEHKQRLKARSQKKTRRSRKK